MKKIMLKLLFAAILVLFRLSLPAQNTPKVVPVPTRMERDMKIFATMLDEYMEKSMGKNNMFNNNTKIEYLDGFGVLVKVSAPTNWSRGRSWVNGKIEKLDNIIENIVIPNVPEVRVRTGSGNVKVRTTTKNGRTTIITNDNGKITTQEFDEKNRNSKNRSNNKKYHYDSNDYEQSKADKRQHKEDLAQQKRDLKQHKRDIEQHKRDIEQHKRDIERSQDDVKRLQKDGQNEGREISREESREMKKAMKEAEKEMQQAQREMEQANKEMELANKEMQLAEKEMQKEMAIFQAKEDSANKADDAKTEEAIREFLVQYADLITELKPNERIRIVYAGGVQSFSGFGDNFSWNGEIDNKNPQKSVEVFKNDIDSYKSSKNDKDFKARIKSVAPSKAKESLKIDMLSTIFDKVLADAKSENVKIQGKTQFAYLEDYNIKYDSKIYLKNKRYYSNYYGNDNCNNCDDDDKDNAKDAKNKTDNKSDKDKEKDAKIAQEDENIIKEQALIEKNGKEYFVLYGKTAASELKANEKLIWEIDFGDKNKNPKILNKIIFYVSKNVLEDFDSRKITLEQAMAQVKTEKK